METAQDFIDRYFDGRFKLHGELANMLSDRDAAIRKECADRAEAWYLQGVPEPSRGEYAEDVSRLRAAIMGE